MNLRVRPPVAQGAMVREVLLEAVGLVVEAEDGPGHDDGLTDVVVGGVRDASDPYAAGFSSAWAWWSRQIRSA